ncbi:MAG: hypothetical protein JWR80_2692 [Bradyrhizobium sp.]|nr:hypothetical protein [Bradyrhizobium sp.]
MTRSTYFGEWGDVPVDGDVRPFSMINPVRGEIERNNRRHHYVSKVYMEGFTNARGRIQVYRQESPETPHAVQPAAIGYEKDYYSQPLPGGGQENHRFEDLWNTIESVWPETIRALRSRRLSPAISLNVQGMQAIMRARVPATRDPHALMADAKLRSELKILEEFGALPPEYEIYAGQLDTVPIGINPQHTLLAMREELMASGDLNFRLGFQVLHNHTNTPFLTSDNPVCSYDPRQPVAHRAPYDHSGEIELLFPLTASMLLHGSSKRLPVNTISRHNDMDDERVVRYVNRTIARFAYRLTLGQDRSSDDLVLAHAGLVPTISTDVQRHGNEVQIHCRDIFGPRPALSQYIDTPEKAERLEAKLGAVATRG